MWFPGHPAPQDCGTCAPPPRLSGRAPVVRTSCSLLFGEPSSPLSLWLHAHSVQEFLLSPPAPRRGAEAESTRASAPSRAWLAWLQTTHQLGGSVMVLGVWYVQGVGLPVSHTSAVHTAGCSHRLKGRRRAFYRSWRYVPTASEAWSTLLPSAPLPGRSMVPVPKGSQRLPP